MSTISILSTEDFFPKQVRANEPPFLCHNIQYMSVVFFYHTNCPYSRALMPIFRQLAQSLNGCQFAQVNMQTNRRLVDLSMQTHPHTQITKVPRIMLYLNGVPYITYSDQYTFEALRSWVHKTYELIQQQISFSAQATPTTQTFPNAQFPNVHYNPKERGIAQWSTGMALMGDADDHSYLHVTENIQVGLRR